MDEEFDEEFELELLERLKLELLDELELELPAKINRPSCGAAASAAGAGPCAITRPKGCVGASGRVAAAAEAPPTKAANAADTINIAFRISFRSMTALAPPVSDKASRNLNAF